MKAEFRYGKVILELAVVYWLFLYFRVFRRLASLADV